MEDRNGKCTVDVQKAFDHVRPILNEMLRQKSRREDEQDHEAGEEEVSACIIIVASIAGFPLQQSKTWDTFPHKYIVLCSKLCLTLVY
jgi:hypothetical protein